MEVAGRYVPDGGNGLRAKHAEAANVFECVCIGTDFEKKNALIWACLQLLLLHAVAYKESPWTACASSTWR